MNELCVSKCLTDLTQTILERVFDKNKVAKLIEEHSVVLNKIVFHRLFNLPVNENIVLMKRFGIVTGKSETLEAIGDELSITRERIRQVEQKALRRLTKEVKSDLDTKMYNLVHSDEEQV